MSNRKGGVSLLALCASEPETDVGNGRRFLHRFGPVVLHVAKVGWHSYDDRRWREDEDGAMVRPLAHQTVEAIPFECEEIVHNVAEGEIVAAGETAEQELRRRRKPGTDATNEERDAYGRLVDAVAAMASVLKQIEKRHSARARHGKSSAGSSKMDNMLKEAAPYRSASVEALNPDRLALNCANGTLRFEQVDVEAPEPGEPRVRWLARLDPHRREDMISKLVTTTVPGMALGQEIGDPEVFDRIARQTAPEFFRFLHKVQPNPDIRGYLQRLSGYMLTGLTSEQMIAFFFGIGANGKSTFTDLIGNVLADYAVTLSIDSFAGDTRKGGGDATPDLARLLGARACFASEGDEGVKIREGLVKLLTGGDKLAVRRLHQDFVEIEIQAKVVITGNHKPTIRGDDDGIWRRVHLVDWPVQIPKEERDRHLPEKLAAERDGVLAWMIAGALQFLSLGGLNPPKMVVDLTEEHREESDPIGAFIRVACDVTGNRDDAASPGQLFLAYEIFCRSEGLFAFGQATFTRRLPDQTRKSWTAPDGKQATFVKVKQSVTLYRGLRIRPLYQPVGGVARHSGD
ncbi:hypothetical protein GTW51_23010 [Aurantimonas aggregata]|uniref:SF3 helicase domain-containing protein n=1 Tax=Aurantimonas aggregata TaxID=2047720 RepID=A0A6L9MNJ6_9HYPH|nr:phage/plasmid primase, P4 family [Aurantimonas aggregata]NDV89514.1 hypothetical protein [Aurantimonas aggregata]